jgi:type VI secretion system secreted protein Hcp
MYLKITGSKQGWIKGGATFKTHKDWIAVHSFSWSFATPRDSVSGLATGRRQHKALDLVLDGTGASPLIAQALANNEVLKDVQLDFAAAGNSNRGVLIGLNRTGTIKLTNASVTSFAIAANDIDQMPLEEIQLTYQKIELSSANATFRDDWEVGIT